MQAARQSFNNGGKRGKFIICLGCYPDVNVFSWILKNSHKYHSSKNKKKIWCTELLGYTQLTQCIDKSRFIRSLAFRFSFNSEPFLFSQKPIRLQAIRLHESILRLRNVTSG